MGYWIAHYTGTGTTPKRTGSQFPGIAPYDIYYAADNEPVFIGAVSDKLFERICDVINREDLLEGERFTTNPDRWEHRTELRGELERSFGEYEREELVQKLADAGVPVGPVLEVENSYRLLTDEVSQGMHTQVRNRLLKHDIEQLYLDFVSYQTVQHHLEGCSQCRTRADSHGP
jgi:crotonobetainyl-CoA:carnitine CoA-transferase CaiB-like acyl-CoA transferase